MAASTLTATSIISLPPELLLGVLENIPFKHETIRDISLVHPVFRDALGTYEKSIVKAIKRREMPHCDTDFACEAGDNPETYTWLSKCLRMYDMTDDLMDYAYAHSETLWKPLQGYNSALLYTGVLLLFRVSSIGKSTSSI
jgi:hypothetical protein